METITYGHFSESLHQSVRKARLPLNVTIEVTRRCPLVCAHCYNNLPMGDRKAQLEELSYAEHCRVLDELAEAGCMWLLYTGGEILARKDFLDIYTYARKIGFFITLYTNGTLITPKIADYLATWRPFAIEITLYGRTRETYERLTGVPGSFDRCMEGIRLCLDRGLPLKLKTVAVSLNKHEVWDMQRFAQDDLGVEFRFDSMMNPRIDCSQSPLAVRLTPAECVEFDLQDPDVMNEWKIFTDKFTGPVQPPETSDQLYHCGGGVDGFAISPYGQMSICVLSQNDLYDLRTGSVRAGWEQFLRGVREKKITRLTKCIGCALKAMCGMCPATAELENGDPEAPVDFLCHVAHLRAHAMGQPVPPHGDCEYCEGGVGYEKLLASVALLQRSKPAMQIRPTLAGRLLPLVETPASDSSGGCGSGGCSSCSH
jgi:radical SAM protein with 4Fe4S-binding SPASM domain